MGSEKVNCKFIWCAIEGKAELIVSGDKHLLAYTNSPVLIVSVKKFLKLIR